MGIGASLLVRSDFLSFISFFLSFFSSSSSVELNDKGPDESPKAKKSLAALKKQLSVKTENLNKALQREEDLKVTHTRTHQTSLNPNLTPFT